MLLDRRFWKGNIWKKNLLRVKYVPFLVDLRLSESHKTIKLSHPVGNCDTGITRVEFLFYMIKPHRICYCRPARKNLLRAQTCTRLRLGLKKYLHFGCLAPVWGAGKELRHHMTAAREWQQPRCPKTQTYTVFFILLPNPQLVPRDGCVCPLQTSKLSPLFCPLAMAIIAFLCWDLYSLFLCFFFPLLPLYLRASRRGSFTHWRWAEQLSSM